MSNVEKIAKTILWGAFVFAIAIAVFAAGIASGDKKVAEYGFWIGLVDAFVVGGMFLGILVQAFCKAAK
jgi:hypothetical protein